MHQRKKYWEIFMCQRIEKHVTKCHASKKGKTADIMSSVK